jgi:hypothetical protein
MLSASNETAAMPNTRTTTAIQSNALTWGDISISPIPKECYLKIWRGNKQYSDTCASIPKPAD